VQYGEEVILNISVSVVSVWVFQHIKEMIQNVTVLL